MSAERLILDNPHLQLQPVEPRREIIKHPYERLWRSLRKDVFNYFMRDSQAQVVHPGTSTVDQTNHVNFDTYRALPSEILRQASNYLEEDREALFDALVLCQLHQVNGDEAKRYRKTEAIPYANHPMEMALRVLQMEQDMKLAIACLLHDVPEDVQWKNLNTPKKVINFIRWKFRDYDPEGDIGRLISAKTKTTGKEIEKLRDPKVENYLLESGMGRLIVQQAATVIDPENPNTSLSDKDKETVCGVMYDMCRIFESAFIKKDGQVTFDPRVLFLTIMDNWDNLKTSGFWLANLRSKNKGTAGTVTKLIRTRIFINVAEVLGYRAVASEMTEMLSQMIDITNINEPGFGTNPKIDLESLERRKKQMEIDVRKNLESKEGKGYDREIDIRCYSRLPWGEASAVVRPVIYVHIGRKVEGKNSGVVFNSHNPGYLVGDTESSLSAQIQTYMGRPTTDNVLKLRRDNKAVGTVRHEDSAPRWSATTKAVHVSPSKSGNVPERNLFHYDLTKYTCYPTKIPRTLRNKGGQWTEAFPFFVHPIIYQQQGTDTKGTSFVVVLNGKVFLAKNKIEGSVWEICKQEGLNPAAARLNSFANISEGKPWIKLEEPDPSLLTDMVAKKGKEVKPTDYFFVVKEKRTARQQNAA